MSPVTIFKRDVYRSNDFKQMTGDHSDEWRNTEKNTKQEKKKALKISTNGDLAVCRFSALHVFTCRSQSGAKFECIHFSSIGYFQRVRLGFALRRTYEWNWKFTVRGD